MSYGPVLAAAFLLWPVMSFLGGQGYAPLVGLTGIAALFVARPRMPPAIFAMTGFVFVAWAGLTEVLYGSGAPLVSGSLTDGNFAVKARGVSMILLALVSALTIAATLRAAPDPRASAIVVGILAVQAGLFIVSAFFAEPLLSVFYNSDALRIPEGMQNAGRIANTVALALPLLLPMLVFRWRTKGVLLASALTVGAFTAYLKLGSDSALFALGGMAAAIGLVTILPRLGFRWLFGLLAGYVATAPILFLGAVRVLEPYAMQLPGSFRSRLWSWETVIAKMPEAPFTGHGMNATSRWKETFSTRPDLLAQLPDNWKDYPIVPGHPHNMPLQIWVETGMIGAMIAALSILALGFHLPRPSELRPEIRYGIAGLAGAAAVIISFAYSVWNEGFWGSLALAAAALVLWHRTLKDVAG